VTTNANAPAAFIAQLIQYTDKDGEAQGSKDAMHKYGPYLKSSTLPKNPFIDGANSVAAVADVAITDVTTDPVAAASGTQGWRIWPKIGRIFANDDTTLSDGSTLPGRSERVAGRA
jgi:hypothetical protein